MGGRWGRGEGESCSPSQQLPRQHPGLCLWLVVGSRGRKAGDRTVGRARVMWEGEVEAAHHPTLTPKSYIWRYKNESWSLYVALRVYVILIQRALHYLSLNPLNVANRGKSHKENTINRELLKWKPRFATFWKRDGDSEMFMKIRVSFLKGLNKWEFWFPNFKVYWQAFLWDL